MLANPAIIIVHGLENGGSQLGAANQMSSFDAQGGGEAPQFRRDLSSRQIHIHSDAEDDVFDLIQLGVQFGEDSSHLPAADQDVIRPFNVWPDSSDAPNGADQRGGSGHS